MRNFFNSNFDVIWEKKDRTLRKFTYIPVAWTIFLRAIVPSWKWVCGGGEDRTKQWETVKCSIFFLTNLVLQLFTYKFISLVRLTLVVQGKNRGRTVLGRKPSQREPIPGTSIFFGNRDWNRLFLKQKNDEVEIISILEKRQRKRLFLFLYNKMFSFRCIFTFKFNIMYNLCGSICSGPRCSQISTRKLKIYFR